MQRTRIIFCCLVFVTGLNTAHSQEAEPPGLLNEVIVTATRHTDTAYHLPYSVNLITKKDIAYYQSRTAPESLAGLTGVFVQKTNHGGGSPFVRGLTGNQNLLMIDGVRFNNTTFRFGPNQYMNTIDAFSIEKIEVVRGTGSVQHGSDALGGVIQVFTKEPAFSEKQKFTFSGIARTASQDMEYTGRAEAAFHSKSFSMLAGFTYRKFGDLYGGDTTGRQSPSGYNELAFDVKLKWRIAPKTMLTGAYQSLSQDDVPLYHRVKLENFNYYLFSPQQRQLSYLKMERRGSNAWAKQINITASFQGTLEQRDYHSKGNANRFTEKDRVSTYGLTADIASTISKYWSANTGIEFYYDKVRSNKTQVSMASGTVMQQRGLYPDNAGNTNFSVYSLHHFTVKKYRFEAGLRYNAIRINIPDTSTGSLKLGNVKVTPSSVVANLSALYKLTAHSSVYVSYSSGYRVPNVDDMGTLGLVDFRYEIPAYNLKPERTANTEIGYKLATKPVSISAALFYMHLSDLITRVQIQGQQIGGYNVYAKENSQESFIRGFELSGTVAALRNVSVHAGVSYTYGQNLSAGEPMRRIPPVNGRLLSQYSKGKWKLGGELLFAGKQDRLAKGDKDDNRIPAGGTPGWKVINLYTQFNLLPVTASLAFLNLLNEDYRTHGSGINGVGRSVYLTIQINF